MIILLDILFFIFLFGFLFDRLTRKYVNPYRLYMIFGKKGSGKTTYIAKHAIKYLKAGWTVYCNIEIPGTILFNPEQLGLYTMPEHSVLFIDEVGMIWDNRDYKSFPKHVRDYFKYQRQYKHIVYLMSQTFDVDLKLRNLTDSMYLLSNKFRIFSVARKISKSITIQQGSENQASTLTDQYQFEPIFSPGAIQFTFIPKWKAFYNSYDPKKLPIINGKLMPMNDDQKFSMKHPNIYIIKDFIKNRIKFLSH